MQKKNYILLCLGELHFGSGVRSSKTRAIRNTDTDSEMCHSRMFQSGMHPATSPLDSCLRRNDRMIISHRLTQIYTD